MKRPLVPVAMWFAAGILLGWAVPGSLHVLIAASAGAVLGACFLEGSRPTFLAASLLLTGWSDYCLHEAILSPVDLRHIVGERPQLVSVRGHLLATPEVRLSEDPAGATPAQPRSQAWLQAEAIRKGGDWQPAVGRVLATVPGCLEAGVYGGRDVELFGVLQRPPTASATGLFDYEAYLRREGIHYQLKTASPADWRIRDLSAPPPLPLSDRFIAWASKVLEHDLPLRAPPAPGGLVDQPFDLLRAMTLGWKTPLTDSVSLPFTRTGTMHIFAISGLHIALVVGILVNLLRAVRLPRAGCGVVVIPAIWFYTAATGWQPSAVRSTLMMTIVLMGWSLHRPQDLVNSLAGAALALLAWQPFQLFQAGFQLSFAVVLSIALFQPHIEAWCDRLLKPDPFLAKVQRPRWRGWLDSGVRWITSSLAVSLAAWLGSVVLVACYFHLLTPVGLLVNLVVVPLSSLALMCNLGALCCGDWFPFLTGLFNHSSWLWMHTLIFVSDRAAALPGAWWHVRSPTALEILVFHGFLVWVLVPKNVSPTMRRVCSWGLALGVLACTMQWFWPGGRVRVTVLPAGSGSAVFCEARHGQQLLVDCGSSETAKFVVAPFLGSLGVNTLDDLLLTHGDQRHVEGTQILLREFSMRRCSVPLQPSRSTSYNDALVCLEAARVKLQCAQRGSRVGDWVVLHPAAEDRFPQADDNALVLAQRVDGLDVLLLSDLGARGQGTLMAREPHLHADIVVVGIPSQGEALNDELLLRLHPQVVVLSVGEFPTAQQPRPGFLARIQRHGAEVFSTWMDGAVSLEFSRAGCRVTSMSSRESMIRPRLPADQSGDPAAAR